MKTLPLTQGKEAIVDDDDFEKYGHLNWFAHKRGNETKYFYAVRATGPRGAQQRIYLHVLIAKPGPGMVVDHINHDTLDNRKNNLRVCSKAENCRNRKGPNKGSSSGVRGVSWHEGKRKWQVSLRVDGRDKYIGSYETIGEASKAAGTARVTFFGVFAGK